MFLTKGTPMGGRGYRSSPNNTGPSANSLFAGHKLCGQFYANIEYNRNTIYIQCPMPYTLFCTHNKQFAVG